MITLIIILAYIANIFISRWMNKIMYQKHEYYVIPNLWFIPLLTIVFLIYAKIIEEHNDGVFYIAEEDKNWFTGKNW